MNIRKSNNHFCLLARRTLFLVPVLSILCSGWVQAADVENGKKVFVRCQVCHELKKDVAKVGPSLHGVFGRKAGTLASFPRYTEAMKKADIVWSDETITAFLKAPRTYIPGTLMIFIGLQDDQAIKDLLAYLKSAGGEAE